MAAFHYIDAEKARDVIEKIEFTIDIAFVNDFDF